MNTTTKIIIKRLFILAIILAFTLSISNRLIPIEYLIYFQGIQIAIIGYLVIEIIARYAFRFAQTTQKTDQTAKSVRSVTRIFGVVILVVVVVSYLSQSTALAASIGTISAIVVGFASQNLLGNIISGMYIALTRPFKIGDVITVFGNTGKVNDIGLLNCELLLENDSILRVPSSSLLSTPVVILQIKGSSKDDVHNKQSEIG